MATEDRNGALHSERNGRFISKNKSDAEKTREAERIYNTHGHLSETITLPDEDIPRSVGAKWKNYDIDMQDGTTAHLAEGSKLQNKEIFAGRGCKRKIDDIDRLVKQHGGNPDDWAKVKATADIVLETGEIIKAEIHWYEESYVGKVELKFKEELD